MFVRVIHIVTSSPGYSSWRTFGMFLSFGYYKLCSEHSSTCLLDTHVHAFLLCIPWIGIVGPYDKHIFIFRGWWKILFRNSCNIIFTLVAYEKKIKRRELKPTKINQLGNQIGIFMIYVNVCSPDHCFLSSI